MIDTDKYTGHTPAPWTIDVHKVGDEVSAIVIESDWTSLGNCVLAEVEVENKYSMKDSQLIADAPLLLAEVLRLRKQMVATQERIALANKALHRNADTKSHLAHMICRAIDALELIE